MCRILQSEGAVYFDGSFSRITVEYNIVIDRRCDSSDNVLTRKGHRFKSSPAHHAEVAEWQTRYVQGVVSVWAWEFKSPLRHHALVAQLDRAQPCGG